MTTTDGETVWTAGKNAVAEIFGASVVPLSIFLILVALCFV